MALQGEGGDSFALESVLAQLCQNSASSRGPKQYRCLLSEVGVTAEWSLRSKKRLSVYVGPPAVDRCRAAK